MNYKVLSKSQSLILVQIGIVCLNYLYQVYSLTRLDHYISKPLFPSPAPREKLGWRWEKREEGRADAFSSFVPKLM